MRTLSNNELSLNREKKMDVKRGISGQIAK
jgi:hypothetical protein